MNGDIRGVIFGLCVLGVRDMTLLTSSQTVLPGSAGYGLKIVGRCASEDFQERTTQYYRRLVDFARAGDAVDYWAGES